ncbi:MAG: endonuclease/exonuclease/phosphatase family protein, partial [Sphingomonadales bacterium]|nr:endonuclease/exonuclease/phosphatase family protein [Sphingomonadales bacterium]
MAELQVDFNDIDINASRDFLSVMGGNDLDYLNNIESPYFSTKFDCSYTSEAEFILNFTKNTELKILTFNIQSLSAKFAQFSTFIQNLTFNDCSPDIICLQELWQFPDTVAFNLNGYHPMVYKLRSNSVQGGGIGIYVKRDYTFKINPEFSIFYDRIFESLFVDIDFNGKKVIVGSCYRPNIHPYMTGSEQFNNFFDLFSNLCSCLPSNDVFIVGDFNVNLLHYSLNRNVTEFVDLLFSFGFLQNIIHPTRVSNNSATLIDHVITNSNFGNRKSLILTMDISDHYPIIFFTNYNKPKSKTQQKFSRIFSDRNKLNFSNALRALNWAETIECNHADEAFDKFSQTFNDLFNIYFPLVPIKVCKRFCPLEQWMTAGLLISRSNKLNLFKKSQINPSVENVNRYKTYRNIYNRTSRMAKKLFYEHMFEKSKFNLKSTWSLFNKAINKKPKKNEQNISSIKFNEILLTDKREIANRFNTFYSSIATEIVNSINPPPPLLDPDPQPPDEPTFEFSTNPITSQELIDTFKQLEKKKTSDI